MRVSAIPLLALAVVLLVVDSASAKGFQLDMDDNVWFVVGTKTGPQPVLATDGKQAIITIPAGYEINNVWLVYGPKKWDLRRDKPQYLQFSAKIKGDGNNKVDRVDFDLLTNVKRGEQNVKGKNRGLGHQKQNMLWSTVGNSKFNELIASVLTLEDVEKGRPALKFKLRDDITEEYSIFIKSVVLKVENAYLPLDGTGMVSITSEGHIGRKALLPMVIEPNRNDKTDCPWEWSGLTAWEDLGMPPGGSVTIPENTKVLVSDFGSGTYHNFHIPESSELIFANTEINLNVEGILLEGKMYIGSETCPHTKGVNIQFFGHPSKANSNDIGPTCGSKGLCARGTSTLDVHGKQFRPTWTRLAYTAKRGDTKLVLQQPVKWKKDMDVVVATTIFSQPHAETETVTVWKTDPNDRRIVYLQAPLEYTHYGGVEYQAEVGLLSRTINFSSGDELDKKYGGHVMIRDNAIARVEGARFNNMGQQNVLARYPLHFHLLGSAPESYIRENSFTNGFFRCAVIHGTNDTTVSYNVAYNNDGSCYYVEDGVEEKNMFSYNLGIQVNFIGEASDVQNNGQSGTVHWQDSKHVQPADTSASVFYFSNAYNYIVGNAAVGGFAAIGFPNLPKAIGVHTSWTWMSPETRPTLVFDGNSARGNDWHFHDGGAIYTGGRLEYVTNTPKSTNTDCRPDLNDDCILYWKSGRESRQTANRYGNDEWMVFTNTSMALCVNGAAHWGDRLDLIDFEVSDMQNGLQMFGESSATNGILTGHSGNPSLSDTGDDALGRRRGFRWYDTSVLTIITDTDMVNFWEKSGDWVWQSIDFYDKFVPNGISATRGITYTNVDEARIYGHDVSPVGSSTGFHVYDYDGSNSGYGVPSVVGSHIKWWDDTSDPESSCTWHTSWGLWVCPLERSAGRPKRWVGSIQTGNPTLQPSYGKTEAKNTDPHYVPSRPGDWKYMEYIGNAYHFGEPDHTFTLSTLLMQRVGVMFYTGMGYHWHFTEGTPKLLQLYPTKIQEGSWVVLSISYPKGTTFSLYRRYFDWDSQGDIDNPLTKVSDSTELEPYTWAQKKIDGHEYIFIKLVGDKNLPAGTDENIFERSGVTLWNHCYWNCGDVIIKADCDGDDLCEGSTTPPPKNSIVYIE
eukprot:TRINITY_DN4788_c0_g1_i1.p1 TRINITY_DN4788_c0_g1~~TRINITY_DN4788_c0_g1_i1.p1  ORF type:complete len:1129 (+),score=274.08 TRINITY_DN4788_c0_g1_i1:159-3545(+)